MFDIKSNQLFSLKKNYDSAGKKHALIFLVLSVIAYFAFGSNGLTTIALLYILSLAVIVWNVIDPLEDHPGNGAP